MFNYYLFILGCQFNYYDAEKLALALDSIGGSEVVNAKDADVAIIFACSVRQKAADRILGHIRNWKKKNKKLKVVVTACVLPSDNKRIAKSADIIVDENELISNPHKYISQLIHSGMVSGTGQAPARGEVSPTGGYSGAKSETSSRDSNYQLYNSKTAYVTITAGCNNFCTYCAVPYTRGRETSKPETIILSEVDRLSRAGIDHVILLGQNVNSYGLSDYRPRNMRKNKSQKGFKWTKNNPSPFVQLLRKVNAVNGIKIISFLSPNPQDMSADLIDWMRVSLKFSKNLNLPMQSGSTRILKKMNRRYTRSEYLALVRKIRSAVPDIYLSTDIIIGFPGETKSDYELSVSAAQQCKFDKAFIAIYSPRTGTVAASLKDDKTSYDKKKKRWIVLNKLINI